MSDIMQKNIQKNALLSQDILKSSRDNPPVNKPKNSISKHTDFLKIMQGKPPVFFKNNPKIMGKFVMSPPVHNQIANNQSIKLKQKESVSDIKTDTIQSKSTQKTESAQSKNQTDKDTSLQESVTKTLKDNKLSTQDKIQTLVQNPDIQMMSNAEKTAFFADILADNPDIQQELSDFFMESDTDINNDTDTDNDDNADIIAVLQSVITPFADRISDIKTDTTAISNTDTTAISNTDITDNTVISTDINTQKSEPSVSDKPADSNPAPTNTLIYSHSALQTQEKISFSQTFAKIPADNNTTIILTRSKDNPEQIGINLEPAGMGNADLIIENKDNVVTAIIRADRPETLDLIRKESASLEKHLAESGINLGGSGLQFQQRTPDNNDKNNQTTHTVSMGGISDSVSQEGASSADSVSVYQTILNINPSKGVDVRL